MGVVAQFRTWWIRLFDWLGFLGGLYKNGCDFIAGLFKGLLGNQLAVLVAFGVCIKAAWDGVCRTMEHLIEQLGNVHDLVTGVSGTAGGSVGNSTMANILYFANYIFPAEELMGWFAFLALLWGAACLYRFIKSWLPWGN